MYQSFTQPFIFIKDLSAIAFSMLAAVMREFMGLGVNTSKTAPIVPTQAAIAAPHAPNTHAQLSQKLSHLLFPEWPSNFSDSAMQTACRRLKTAGVFSGISDAIERMYQPTANAMAQFSDEIIVQYLATLPQVATKQIYTVNSIWNSFKPSKIAELFKHPKNIATFNQAELILWPYHKDAHWYLAIVNKSSEAYSIQVLDSLNMHCNHAEIIQHIQAVLKHFNRNLVCERTKSLTVPRQDNFVDCGVSICYFATLAAKNIPIPTVTADSASALWHYGHYRLSIAQRLLPETTVDLTHDRSTTLCSQP